ncbi:indolepyruvate ferredoxin oxidoreductase beta subunit [Desulfurella multipotens]|uniref:Indolepyruvate ferredoxin oxidoreductase beta subunit n=1 Tax=Desulfurella multipotens TaxID=79269 RepID=A0A1G6IP91_9BACT|nr:2-oxoacid:acceptor oxidoreductase family protein [Desulfurella multipotens]SDC08241.1 indolepyruvate ferredoxin oxidoreductase beta subunit [Desulfurella multipotens]
MKIVLLGRGGEGVLYLSRLIIKSFDGQNILSSEIHGMAKKGGLVEVHLKIGDYKSPTIGYKKADLVVLLNNSLKKLAYLYSQNIIFLSEREQEYILKSNPKMLNIYMFAKLAKVLNIDYQKAISLINKNDAEFFNKGFNNDIQ